MHRSPPSRSGRQQQMPCRVVQHTRTTLHLAVAGSWRSSVDARSTSVSDRERNASSVPGTRNNGAKIKCEVAPTGILGRYSYADSRHLGKAGNPSSASWRLQVRQTNMIATNPGPASVHSPARSLASPPQYGHRGSEVVVRSPVRISVRASTSGSDMYRPSNSPTSTLAPCSRRPSVLLVTPAICLWPVVRAGFQGHDTRYAGHGSVGTGRSQTQCAPNTFGQTSLALRVRAWMRFVSPQAPPG